MDQKEVYAVYVRIYMCTHILYIHRGFTFVTTTVDSTASVDYSGSDLMRRDPEPGQLWSALDPEAGQLWSALDPAPLRFWTEKNPSF